MQQIIRYEIIDEEEVISVENRIITVKGVGSARVKVDYIVVSLTLNSIDEDYDEALIAESQKLNAITNCLMKAGFDKKDIKTSDFRVVTQYESIRDENDNYKKVFKGYQCYHKLKISFDYDVALLNKILSAVSKSNSKPNINISFTVKDQNVISEELLKSACQNAKRKADILCEASGYKLGQLLKINYNWTDIYYESKTNYETPSFLRSKSFCEADINIEPEDIDVSDNAVFIWEIE